MADQAMMQSVSHPVRQVRHALRGIVLALAVGFGLTLATPSLAQDAAGIDAWGRGNCSNCHGGLAQGGAGGEQPAGPSLRATRLDRAALVETISCGRPGTGMPYNLAGAYTTVACYGLPVGQVPAGTAKGGSELTAAQVGALADFLIANVVGKTRITRVGCAAFLGGDVASLLCASYPAQ